jgi:methylenetetrahydrofolate--tRNA-(uracil-5-)-methyltransferase
MRFGPMKPVGLMNPHTGRRPFAVVQLRQDNLAASHFSMVGFQTHLKWPEQKRIFRMIPGLENAEFVRFGMIHRNTYINSPKTLHATFEARVRPGLFFAGQINGVEGYVESAASGLLAGIAAAARAHGEEPVAFPVETAMRALPVISRQRSQALPAHQHRFRASPDRRTIAMDASSPFRTCPRCPRPSVDRVSPAPATGILS